MHPALVVEWGVPGAPLQQTCQESWEGPPPLFAAMDVLAEATKRYGSDAPFPHAFYIWPGRAAHPPKPPVNDSDYFSAKFVRIAREKAVKKAKMCAHHWDVVKCGKKPNIRPNIRAMKNRVSNTTRPIKRLAPVHDEFVRLINKGVAKPKKG